MKTAMQDLKDDLNKSLSVGNKSLNDIDNPEIKLACQELFKQTIQLILTRIENELLELEKQNLLDMSVRSALYERKWLYEEMSDKKYKPTKVEIRDLKITALEHYNITFKSE